MKKTLWFLILIMGMLTLGVSHSYAVVPIIDGSASSFAGEWTNDSGGSTPYPYFLEVFDPNELAIPDAYDIKHAVLLQELTSFSGDGNFANDGIYLLIETYANPSLEDLDHSTPTPAAVSLAGDFDGDGIPDFFAEHKPSGTLLDKFLGKNQAVTVDNFAAGVFGKDLITEGGAFSIVNGSRTGAGCSPGFLGCTPITAIEYYFPSGKFGTPPSPPGTVFPFSFIGSIFYDNSGAPPDDFVLGRLAIPEPSTMLLLGVSLLGLVGYKRFGASN